MLGKALAGLVPGAALSLAICGMLAYATPAGWRSASIVAMMLALPLWIGLIAVAFALPARRAWLALGVPAVLAWIALLALRAWIG